MQNIVINLLMLHGQMEQFDMFMLHQNIIGIKIKCLGLYLFIYLL